MSDKVPQGRGVAPVQLLSRRTPDSMTRMSNLQTLIGNSFKYLLPRVPLSVGLLFEIHAWRWAAMIIFLCRSILLFSTLFSLACACTRCRGMFAMACLLTVAVLKNFLVNSTVSALCRLASRVEEHV